MLNREQETAMLDQREVVGASYETVDAVQFAGENPREPDDQFELMSDRELLLSMARDAAAVKELISGAVEQVAPLLSNPKLKLLLKML